MFWLAVKPCFSASACRIGTNFNVRPKPPEDLWSCCCRYSLLGICSAVSSIQAVVASEWLSRAGAGLCTVETTTEILSSRRTDTQHLAGGTACYSSLNKAAKLQRPLHLRQKRIRDQVPIGTRCSACQISRLDKVGRRFVLFHRHLEHLLAHHDLTRCHAARSP